MEATNVMVVVPPVREKPGLLARDIPLGVAFQIGGGESDIYIKMPGPAGEPVCVRLQSAYGYDPLSVGPIGCCGQGYEVRRVFRGIKIELTE